MKSPLFTTLCCAALFAACSAPQKKPSKTQMRSPVAAPETPAVEDSGDVAFQSFVSRLRAAVAAKDLATLASMMPSDFGHRWDDAPRDESPFDYWDQNNLWPELTTVLNSKWTPHDGFMVAPTQMINDSAYPGFRAGVAMKDGSWKFAYFVPPPTAQ